MPITKHRCCTEPQMPFVCRQLYSVAMVEDVRGVDEIDQSKRVMIGRCEFNPETGSTAKQRGLSPRRRISTMVR